MKPHVTFDVSSWTVIDQEVATIYARGRVAREEVLDDPAGAIEDLGGALVVVTDERVEIFQDRIRSYPVLYTTTGELVIGDDPHAIARHVPLRLAKDSVREFDAMGFVSGTDTLYEGLAQTLQGTRTTIDVATREVSVEDWGRFAFARERTNDTDEFEASFSAALDEVLGRLVDEAGSHQIVVPLSGGFDSRLLIAWFVSHDVRNVVTFTYGVKDSRESHISSRIAAAAGYPWHFVEYGTPEMIRRWHAPNRADFLRYCYGGVSLPHVQDWYALEVLIERGIIQRGDIVAPGHTIVGKMHDENLVTQANTSCGEIAKAIADKHYCLQGPYDPPEANERYRMKLADFLREMGFDGTGPSAQSAIVGYNMRERQAKYINNSMRGYEYYGLRWALPMLEKPLWDAWSTGSVRLTSNRTWYGTYVERLFRTCLGDRADDVPVYQPIQVDAEARNRLKTMLASVGLLNLANRAYSAWASLNDSLRLDMYITDDSRMRAAYDLMRGRQLLGFWTSAFTRGRWSEGGDVVLLDRL